MPVLRPFQIRAVAAVHRAWDSGSHGVLLCLPTGAGKTVVAARLISDRPSDRVLFLCPWRELAHQAIRRLVDQGIRAGLLLDHRTPASQDRCTVTTVATAARRTLGDYDLIVVDEAHRAVAAECSRILFRYPRGRLLGITATPRRHDGRALSRVFDRLIVGATTAELIASGVLSPWVVWGPEHPFDVHNVPIDVKTKDFSTGHLSRAVDRPHLYADALREYRRLSRGRPTAIYCVDLAHARKVLDTYQAAGIRAAIITGDTPDQERAELFERFRSGRLDCLVNVAVLTEGIDLPELAVIQCLRPTLSLTLWRQILGRGSRRAPNKLDCLVMDHADNTRRHGMPTEEPDWSLSGNLNDRANKQPRPIVRCPRCGRLHRADRECCEACGERLPVTIDGILVELQQCTVFV